MLRTLRFRTLPLTLCFLPCATMAGPKLLPVLNHPVTDRSGLAGFPLTVDLNAAFGTEAIDDQVVRFTSQFNNNGVPVVLDFALFSYRTPVTRGNFLNYVADGDYVDSIIHRSMPGFVVQGGGFRLNNGSIESVPTDPPIINEFGVSNTLGTISMAKLGGDPDSATSQWFVSLGANSDNLDNQNGGFTVFGRVTKSTFGNAQVFGNPSVFPIYDYSAFLGSAFTDLPLFYEHVPSNIYPEELLLFNAVALAPLPPGEAGEDPVLAYSVVSNSNPTVAAASMQAPAALLLSPQSGQTGSTAITVRATDSVGNTVDDTFVLTVVAADTYSTWASRTAFPGGQNAMARNPDGDSLNNLQEFAFLGDPAVSNQTELPVAGKTGVSPAPLYQTLTFPVRKFTSGLSYAVQAAASPTGPWSVIWSSADEFAHPLVAATLEQPDRTVVTIRDSVALSDGPRRFMRVRTIQQ